MSLSTRLSNAYLLDAERAKFIVEKVRVFLV